MSAAIRHPGEYRWETRLLAVTTLVLTAMGIASCYAAGAYVNVWFHEATQQAMAAVVGGVLFLVAASMDYRWWQRMALPLFLGTIAGLVLIGIVAIAYKGRAAPGAIGRFFPVVNASHRWIKIGGSIQFAEIARVTLVLWLATWAASMGKKVRQFNDGYVLLVGVIGATCFLVGIEPSVAMAAVLCAVGLAVVFTAGARVPHILVTVVIAGAAVLLIMKLSAVRAGRAETFRGGALKCTGGQECQSLIGFGQGHIFGVGYGKGTQKFGLLPDAYSDYLLSVIGEEWGLIGMIVIAALYGVFCWLGYRIARTAPDAFGTYVAAGLTTGIGATAFLHAGVVTWLLPSTGVTLPFMSVGRISLLISMLAAGIIVSIGRQRGRPARKE